VVWAAIDFLFYGVLVDRQGISKHFNVKMV